MQTRKDLMLNYNILDRNKICHVLNNINVKYNCNLCEENFLKENIFLELSGDNFSQVFIFKAGEFNKLMEVLNGLKALRYFPYSVGMPIVVVHERENEVEPLIPFGYIMLKYCNNIFTIPDSKHGEKFTYGKEIVIVNKGKKYLPGYYLVVSPEGYFLGYARLNITRQNEVVVIPIRDIGWYLRKGR